MLSSETPSCTDYVLNWVANELSRQPIYLNDRLLTKTCITGPRTNNMLPISALSLTLLSKKAVTQGRTIATRSPLPVPKALTKRLRNPFSLITTTPSPYFSDEKLTNLSLVHCTLQLETFVGTLPKDPTTMKSHGHTGSG